MFEIVVLVPRASGLGRHDNVAYRLGSGVVHGCAVACGAPRCLSSTKTKVQPDAVLGRERLLPVAVCGITLRCSRPLCDSTSDVCFIGNTGDTSLKIFQRLVIMETHLRKMIEAMI